MKSPQAFRSIGEVARLVGVATHVLRYWETQFSALAPVRRPDGRRYYRPDDLLLAAGLCEVMREDGLTIRGAQRLISMDKGAALRERGRLRLQATLGEQPQETAARGRNKANSRGSPPRSRSRADGAGMAATTRRDGQPSAQADAADTARCPADGPLVISPPEKADGSWLGRLVATATALRVRTQPLPDAAQSLHEALRTPLDARP